TAIPAVGEGAAQDAALAGALRSAALANPAKPVLVVHVELGGLAEALSAAASTGPQPGGSLPQPPAPGASAVTGTPGVPPDAEATAVTSSPPAPETPPGPETPAPRLIPAYPAAERAVRALAEAVRYGQWRREAAEPGKVPEYEDIDEKGAAALVAGLLDRGQGLTP
ncbi:acyl-CoA synthetase, partial [Streptomyces sp. SID625]|nr:acyl-CoA synthetase [Streptomyces sp. SID625]